MVDLCSGISLLGSLGRLVGLEKMVLLFCGVAKRVGGVYRWIH